MDKSTTNFDILQHYLQHHMNNIRLEDLKGHARVVAYLMSVEDEFDIINYTKVCDKFKVTRAPLYRPMFMYEIVLIKRPISRKEANYDYVIHESSATEENTLTTLHHGSIKVYLICIKAEDRVAALIKAEGIVKENDI